MSYQPDDPTRSQTDQGVPVGAADAQADVERASGEERPEPDRDEYFEEGAAAEEADQGVPVGAADAEQDRLNAREGDASDA